MIGNRTKINEGKGDPPQEPCSCPAYLTGQQIAQLKRLPGGRPLRPRQQLRKDDERADKQRQHQVEHQQPAQKLKVRTDPAAEVALDLLHAAVERLEVGDKALGEPGGARHVPLRAVPVPAQQPDRFGARRPPVDGAGQLLPDLALGRDLVRDRFDRLAW